MSYKLLTGDAVEMLKTLEDKSVKTCITSPPYYGLRDYGVDGQIGMEETPDEYINRLVEVFREVKRVIKDDGTLWVNIGDSYCSSNGMERVNNRFKREGSKGASANDRDLKVLHSCVYKTKDLMLIPFELAKALRDDDWYLRDDVIWCLSGGVYIWVKTKKGVMPIMVRELARMNLTDVQLWGGDKWVNISSFKKNNCYNRKIRLVLRSGERISCTDGHRWILSDGTEKIASELTVGDVLKTCNLPDDGTHNPGFLTDDVLWFLGLYLAEGSLSDDCIQISLNSDEFGWYDRLRSVAEYMGGTSTYTLNGNCLDVRMYSKVLLATIKQYIGGRCAKNKHLNNICWRLSNSDLKKIIVGYLDGDGHIDEENRRIRLGFTRNYYLERDLRIAASRLGAIITLNLSTSKIGDREYKTFRGEWRWDRSGHLNEKERSEIVKIENANSTNFYDIEIDSNEHIYSLASGVLTHNCKTNPMPESVTDRCTRCYEHIFLLSKSPKYYFDSESIKEPATSSNEYVRDRDHTKLNNTPGRTHMGGLKTNNYEMRNKRNVWDVPVSSYKGAHFATYPEKLVEPCVLAGSSEGDTILDVFNGSGTTGAVALKNKRDYIGIDLNQEYIDLSEERLKWAEIEGSKTKLW